MEPRVAARSSLLVVAGGLGLTGWAVGVPLAVVGVATALGAAFSVWITRRRAPREG